MVRSWIEAWRQRRLRRGAINLEGWLAWMAAVLEASGESLRPQGSLADLNQALTRIDSRLERLRQAEASAWTPLRSVSGDLPWRLRETTDHAFRLRNQVVAFFIRWRAFQDVDESRAWTNFTVRREMDEALLTGRRSLERLTGDVDSLQPELEALARQWSQGALPQDRRP